MPGILGTIGLCPLTQPPTRDKLESAQGRGRETDMGYVQWVTFCDPRHAESFASIMIEGLWHLAGAAFANSGPQDSLRDHLDHRASSTELSLFVQRKLRSC